MKFIEILKEDKNSNKKSKYINMLVNMMKDHFTEPEGGLITWSTDWINNTNIGDYKNKISEFIDVNNQMTEIHNKLSDVIKLTPKQIYELGKQKRELTEKWENLYNHIRHIYELFRGADENNFINEYGLTLGILLEVWEKFYNEVYIPARINDRVSKSKFSGVLYGLPEGNYSKDKKLDSINGGQFYLVLTDKDNGDYILGIDKEWEWDKEGVDLSKLYHKRFNSLDDLKRELHDVEIKKFISSHDSYLDNDDLKDVIQHIEMSSMDDIKDDWEEEKEYESDLTFEEFLGDEINRYLMNEKGMGYGYLSSNQAESLASDYIKLDKILSDIYNF
jgi:hypothetical protein